MHVCDWKDLTAAERETVKRCHVALFTANGKVVIKYMCLRYIPWLGLTLTFHLSKGSPVIISPGLLVKANDFSCDWNRTGHNLVKNGNAYECTIVDNLPFLGNPDTVYGVGEGSGGGEC